MTIPYLLAFQNLRRPKNQGISGNPTLAEVTNLGWLRRSISDYGYSCSFPPPLMSCATCLSSMTSIGGIPLPSSCYHSKLSLCSLGGWEKRRPRSSKRHASQSRKNYFISSYHLPSKTLTRWTR